MQTQTLTLNVPEPLYVRLKEQAKQAQRSVEDEMLAMLSAAATLPLELSEAVSALQTFDDAALWRAARTRLPSEVSTALEALHRKRQREALTEAEETHLKNLLHQYERNMLVRAQAAALLRQRGHNVDELLAS